MTQQHVTARNTQRFPVRTASIPFVKRNACGTWRATRTNACDGTNCRSCPDCRRSTIHVAQGSEMVPIIELDSKTTPTLAYVAVTRTHWHAA